ncbi:hypothetical protein TNCT_49741 [Trichonephila clavata]|uniref:Uncharacterized protein n=1 Tax=Trichonephila clavata TaxID=2740835 RepID=A0A8X6KPA8_TRICU|nr:hypothetical protein TNCT_49741 [Trichonephila clavata]
MDFETVNLNAVKVYGKLKEFMNKHQGSEQLLQNSTQLLKEIKKGRNKRNETDVLKEYIEETDKQGCAMKKTTKAAFSFEAMNPPDDQVYDTMPPLIKGRSPVALRTSQSQSQVFG